MLNVCLVTITPIEVSLKFAVVVYGLSLIEWIYLVLSVVLDVICIRAP